MPSYFEPTVYDENVLGDLPADGQVLNQFFGVNTTFTGNVSPTNQDGIVLDVMQGLADHHLRAAQSGDVITIKFNANSVSYYDIEVVGSDGSVVDSFRKLDFSPANVTLQETLTVPANVDYVYFLIVGSGASFGSSLNYTFEILGRNTAIDPGTIDAAKFFTSTSANESFTGGRGDDSVTFHGGVDQYTITRTSATTYRIGDNIGGRDGTDTATNIEHLKFSDRSINLTMGAEAQKISAADLNAITELYVAYFNRVPEASGLAYWIDQRAAGVSLNDISKQFYAAGVQFSDQTGYSAAMSNTDFIKVVYSNVLGRTGATAPTTPELQYWNTQIATGAVTKEGLIQRMLSDAHQFAGDRTWGWVPSLLDNKVSVGRAHAVDLGVDYNSQASAIAATKAIAAAVTPTGTDIAVGLIGLADNVHLT